jgi:hypothetical protein
VGTHHTAFSISIQSTLLQKMSQTIFAGFPFVAPL